METFSALLALRAGNSPVSGEFQLIIHRKCRQVSLFKDELIIDSLLNYTGIAVVVRSEIQLHLYFGRVSELNSTPISNYHRPSIYGK